MPPFDETVTIPPKEGFNSFKSARVTRSTFKGEPYIQIQFSNVRGDGGEIFVFSVEAASMLATVLYGAYEHTDDPRPFTFGPDIGTGDLVKVKGVEGGYEHTTLPAVYGCLVWGRDPDNHTQIRVTIYPGTPTTYVDIGNIELVEKNHRPRSWFTNGDAF